MDAALCRHGYISTRVFVGVQELDRDFVVLAGSSRCNGWSGRLFLLGINLGPLTCHKVVHHLDSNGAAAFVLVLFFAGLVDRLAVLAGLSVEGIAAPLVFLRLVVMLVPKSKGLLGCNDIGIDELVQCMKGLAARGSTAAFLGNGPGDDERRDIVALDDFVQLFGYGGGQDLPVVSGFQLEVYGGQWKWGIPVRRMGSKGKSDLVRANVQCQNGTGCCLPVQDAGNFGWCTKSFCGAHCSIVIVLCVREWGLESWNPEYEFL